MFYLIQHIWLCFLLAAILGALLMWLLRHLLMKDKVSEVNAAWQTQWNNLESEHLRVSRVLQDTLARASLIPGLEADIEKLQANCRTLTDRHTALDADWKRKYDTLEKDWREKYTGVEKGLADLRGQLTASAQERDTFKANLGELRQQLTATEQERENLRTQLVQMTASESEWRGKWQDVEGKHASAQQQIAGLMTRVATLSALEARYKVAEERLGGDIERIEGIGPTFGQRLRSTGIAWVVDLLDQCAAPDGRAMVAEKTGFTPTQLLTWTNIADLLRIPGMTPDWAELLHAAGVDTVKELKQRVPENLQQKMAEVNATAERKISSTVPDVSTVHSWVQRANDMESRITY